MWSGGRFGTNMFSAFSGNLVYPDESFLDPTEIPVSDTNTETR